MSAREEVEVDAGAEPDHADPLSDGDGLALRQVADDPAGEHLATASADQTVRIWDIGDWRKRVLIGHSGDVYDATYSGDGNWIATTGVDGWIRIWDAQSGRERKAWQYSPDSPGESATSAVFSPDDRQLLTSSDDGTWRLWDVDTGKQVFISDYTNIVHDARYSRDGTRIVTTDPHAYNTLTHDYSGLPPVEHISQVIARNVKDGRISFEPLAGNGHVYAYHDPCYLGRHNGVYDEPRELLDAIPGLKRVEMSRSRDRSFCCGGGGLALFYEPRETERMGVRRVRMAADAGANVIVTACPFCMVNIEDAVKVAGLEGQMSVVDLTELVERQLTRRHESERATANEPRERSGESGAPRASV